MVRTVGIDPGETKLLEDIEKFGWHCLNILGEGELPPYSFTVGLFHTYQHPELIIFGLPANVAHQILHIAVEAIKGGNPIDLALATEELLESYSCCFVEVPVSHYRENVGFCRWFYEGDAFPWHSAASESFRSIQPILGASRHGT